MATYFDPNKQEDAALLAASARKATELANVAAAAEADVIAHYTGRPRDTRWTAFDQLMHTGQWLPQNEMVANGGALGHYVFLRGFAVDSTAADAQLADALRRTIADVISWRLAMQKVDPAVTQTSESGGSTRVYSPLVREPFPPDFDWRLAPFDTRVGSKLAY